MYRTNLPFLYKLTDKASVEKYTQLQKTEKSEQTTAIC